MNSDEVHSKIGAALLLAQLRSRYELRMEEPYDRAVACHLIRRAARDKGLQVIVVLGFFNCLSHGEVRGEVCASPPNSLIAMRRDSGERPPSMKLWHIHRRRVSFDVPKGTDAEIAPPTGSGRFGEEKSTHK